MRETLLQLWLLIPAPWKEGVLRLLESLLCLVIFINSREVVVKISQHKRLMSSMSRFSLGEMEAQEMVF